MTTTSAAGYDLSQLCLAAGTRLGVSDWLSVEQARIDCFADATGDHQWIHVDAEQAASGPFGTTIAHGYLTLSLVPALVWQVYRTEGLSMEINYGLDRVRFPAPVGVGSRIRAVVDLLSVDPSGEGFQVRTRITVEIEGGDKPACVAETLAYVVPSTVPTTESRDS
ncbi:Acyl dehydratase [Nocardioides sp. YR527]|uniref:MaoC family dehydratase n=1 Tax=Nocardioides sp. YR527 TaxID=1881028 RepID=UPI00088DAF78|nr:MaoC family dehydratase [Nocardioides sp. YR527]SDK27344.1 Acyl dehydratase [Nocardioides sp. YR527]